ncbi:ATPase AAA [Streptomyces rimosus subsp. rimosus]|uniref:AAA family ATPase n=3 Tax=Streptomyces TaxID=1883 RepID=A0A8A1UWM5_STRR1|nr:NB-ARC domain-containing protein [Streptomyces rimosus]KOT45676.1 ATPase AAA [Streptomyces rimosus subsp. rimosus]KOT46952.1 ATPase AAA [Streptomyces sp. NRRL WC-3701]MYT44414.1 AAA family ATPase [Streptomyces sp. SID5471]QGY65542.1 AAA family ATPase [Streptomyces rimosus R6-500]QST82465.1 AAA family ATPase [Streptomyces rimosus subsp. rimosus ATCC 10970]
MSSSATRLTCFALLSAIEEDLRAAILGVCDAADDARSILSSKRYEKVILRQPKEANASSTSVASLVQLLDFADAYEVLSRLKSRLPEDHQATVSRFAPHLSALTQVRNRVAHTRPMEIDDLPTVHDVAKEICASSKSHWSNVCEVLRKLEDDPSYVLGLTISLVADPDNAPQHNLPAPEFDETGFFGRRKELDRIKKVIKGAYPVVSVLGDGGIGKTSIALKAAYELLDDPKVDFDAFVWVTAKATSLTVNEIQRISGAIETSLGLFTSAAEQLGGKTAARASDPIEEVLSYLEHFRVLLILDNLETVLDQRLRDFLLDIPTGSKVIVTSRIGLGIENPVALSPLSDDDSTRLLYTLTRVRDVRALQGLPSTNISSMVRAMKGHPLYIRWFVAGVQAGKRPEELFNGNKLLLDFCMSNVYQYLNDEARSVLRSMQVLPGRRSQGELAFLNSYSASSIQSSLLELMKTNFVQMQGASGGETSVTTYRLTEFGKQYLDKHHAVKATDRTQFESRSNELTELGTALQAESTASPYDPKTIDIQGSGDYSVAQILRKALREYDRSEFDKALASCREAQTLAPTYHEAWRAEAFIHVGRKDLADARAAYEQAYELAPDSATLNYFYGSFLVDESVDYQQGLELLQRAAVLAEVPPAVINQITWAHIQLRDYAAAVVSTSHALSLKPTRDDGSVAVTMGARAAVYGTQQHLEHLRTGEAVETIEAAVEIAESARLEILHGETSDRLVQLIDLAEDIGENSDEEFMAVSCRNFAARLRDRLRALDAELLTRRVGNLKAVRDDRKFGFVRSWGREYFFHLSDLQAESDWSYLLEGVPVAFTPDEENERGPRATQLRWLG